ncbi:hypothetical protein VOLCADRAFT_115562, partial [Volvox carteri f. nagariensis]
APHLYAAHDDLDPTRLHKLATAEEFWDAFGARYGTSNPHLLPAANQPVAVPTTVFAGELDRRYTREQIHAWSRHLFGPHNFVWLPNTGHDYVERGHPVLLNTLGGILAAL